MNKITCKIFVAVLLIGNLSSIYGQCLPDGIIFTSQSQIDNFSNNYPGCSEIMGNINVEEDISGNIINLNGLLQVTAIDGNLLIANNANLLNLQGLNNINSLQGNLAIYGNTLLESLEGIDNITALGDGSGVGLFFFQNINVSNLHALSNVESINGTLIVDNTWLTNLDGLENLQYINGGVRIENNFRLTDIEGLKNIDPTQISQFVIKQNNALSNCAIESLCNYFDQIPSAINIENNAPGCNYISEVRASCALGTEENQITELKIYPNPTNGTFEISGLKIGTIEIIDSQGRTVKKIVPTENSYSISELSSGIYFIKVTSEKSSITKQLIKT